MRGCWGFSSWPAGPVRAALCCLCTTAVTLAQGAWQDVVQRAEAGGLRTGFVALDLATGRVLAEHGADRALLPASNQKLLTASAFLAELGSDYRFRTGFAVRQGRLVVEAGGDPNWITGSDHDPAALFAAVAARLAAAGVGRLRGVDLARGRFTGPGRPSGWPGDQLHLHYCAPSGAVLLDRSCWRLRVARGGGAHDADVRLLAPPGGLRLGGRIELTDDRKAGGNFGARVDGEWLRLSGQFWERGEPREPIGAVENPEAVFLQTLRHELRRAGLTIDDPTAAAVSLDLPVIETPLAPALRRTLAASSNVDAEQLLRVLGAERRQDGSLAGGGRAVRDVLTEFVGTPPPDLAVADGSGLSRDDRVTAGYLAHVLRAGWRAPWADALRTAMAQPGEADSTMRRRFRDAPHLHARVWAKTGTIRGVSALSGVVLDAAREGGVVFAILMNWKSGSSSPARARQEELVRAVAR